MPPRSANCRGRDMEGISNHAPQSYPPFFLRAIYSGIGGATVKRASGFTIVPNEVLATGNGYAIAVYVAIVRHADQKGVAFPSITTLANLTGWSRPTVIKAIDALESAGVLQRERRTENNMRTSNQYRVVYAPKTPKDQQSTSLTTQSTTFTAQSTSLTDVVNDVDSGSKPRLPEVDPFNKTQEQDGALRVVRNEDEPKPAVKGDTPAHHLVNRFYEIIGGMSPNPGKDIGHGKTLHTAGITPDDLPAMIDWARRDWCGRDGFDLATLARNATRFRTANTGKPENRLPDWVTVEPGEKVQQVGEGAWDITHGGYGYTRKIRPQYGRVIFDSRKHQSYEGQRDFAALVRAETEARAS